MIGPSSSHTAGAVRLGRLARAVFGRTPVRADVTLHGSFASTGRGHGTDLAIVAGLLGLAADDPGIRDAFTLAKEAGLDVTFAEDDLGEVNPNTARFKLVDAEGRTMCVQGSSVGGGDVVVTRIDAFDVEVTGELPVLVVAHIDRPGVIAAVTAVLAQSGVNIASLADAREQRGAAALMLIATDQPVSEDVAERVREVHDVTAVRAVPAV